MTAPSIACAIYTRKSSDDGLEQDFNSLDAQREACAAYIASQKAGGWRLVPDRYDDGGVSGGTLKRPALQRVLDDVKAGRVQAIVVYKIDRLTRSLTDFARLVDLLDDHDASFVSVTQQFNTTTSMGRLTLNVLLSFAQFEREVTSERIRDKVAASKRKGLWMGGYPPLGYDIVNRRLEVNAAEAEQVRRIFELALKVGSLSELEVEARAAGFSAKRWRSQTDRWMGGGPLSRSALARLLRNPVYLGKVRQGDALYESAHDGVVSRDLWENVQKRLDKGRAGSSGKKRASNALLRGKLYDDAGRRMVPSHVRKGARRYFYYLSAPLLRGRGDPVGSVSRVSAPRIEASVLQALNASGAEGPDAERLISMVERVVVSRDHIKIRMTKDSGGETLSVPINLSSTKSGLRLLDQTGANRKNEELIRVLALAHGWRRALEGGRYPSVAALAAAEARSERYVWKILRLAYLAPDIVCAVLQGGQPTGLSLSRINKTAFSADWRSGRRALGFPDPA